MSFTEIIRDVREVLDTKLFEIGGTTVTVATALTLVIIMVMTFWISRLLRRGVERSLRRRVGVEGTIGAITGLLHYAVLGIGFAIALDTAGVNLTALFAAGAVFAVGLGFAMQNIAQNFVSGIILLVERSIKPGDIIKVESMTVKIQRIGIRATIVDTRDGESVIVPNSTIVQSAVTNYTLGNSLFRLRITVGVVYSSDMRKVEDALLAAAETLKGRFPDRAPEVQMTEFGDNSVNFHVMVWVDDPWRAPGMRSELAKLIWWRLADEDVVIAFPQVDVHLDPPVVQALERLGGRAA